MPEIATPEHLQFRYWLHYAEGTFMPRIRKRPAYERALEKGGPYIY